MPPKRNLNPTRSRQPDTTQPSTFSHQTQHNKVVVVNSLNQSHPFLYLAEIRQPAGVSVITNSMLRDRRELLSPRRAELVLPRPVVSGDVSGKSHVLNHKLNENGLRAEQFPDASAGGEWSVDIPSWASRMTVEAQITGVRYDCLLYTSPSPRDS